MAGEAVSRGPRHRQRPIATGRAGLRVDVTLAVDAQGGLSWAVGAVLDAAHGVGPVGKLVAEAAAVRMILPRRPGACGW